MDELERRLAAVELLLVDLAPWIDASAIEDTAATIRSELRLPMTADEAEIRLQALQLLTDGRKRFVPFEMGQWIRSGGS